MLDESWSKTSQRTKQQDENWAGIRQCFGIFIKRFYKAYVKAILVKNDNKLTDNSWPQTQYEPIIQHGA